MDETDRDVEPDNERASCRYCGADYVVDEWTWQQTRCPECGSWNDRPPFPEEVAGHIP